MIQIYTIRVRTNVAGIQITDSQSLRVITESYTIPANDTAHRNMILGW